MRPKIPIFFATNQIMHEEITLNLNTNKLKQKTILFMRIQNLQCINKTLQKLYILYVTYLTQYLHTTVQ